MNKHFKISLIKSILRILGSIGSLILLPINLKLSIGVLGGSFLIAEILGIYEEIKDDRK